MNHFSYFDQINIGYWLLMEEGERYDEQLLCFIYNNDL